MKIESVLNPRGDRGKANCVSTPPYSVVCFRAYSATPTTLGRVRLGDRKRERTRLAVLTVIC